MTFIYKYSCFLVSFSQSLLVLFIRILIFSVFIVLFVYNRGDAYVR